MYTSKPSVQLLNTYCMCATSRLVGKTFTVYPYGTDYTSLWMECAPLNFPNILAGYGVYRKIQNVVKNYGPRPGNKLTVSTVGIYRGIFQQCLVRLLTS